MGFFYIHNSGVPCSSSGSARILQDTPITTCYIAHTQLLTMAFALARRRTLFPLAFEVLRK